MIANRALEPLEFLIGDWQTTGTHPQMPGKALEGRTSFSWHEDGSFIVMRSHVDHPEFPDGLAIIGSDSASSDFAMIYFDVRGVSRIMTVEAADGTVIWRHDDPQFAQVLTIVAKDKDQLKSTGRMSQAGGPWTDDLSQTFVRTGALDAAAGEP